MTVEPDEAPAPSARAAPPPRPSRHGHEAPPPPSRMRRAGATLGRVLRRHAHFVGPGIMSSVAFMDPGNWATDLSAGAQFGYRLLFVLLLAALIGILLQVLAVRMGVVSGVDLARGTRLLLLPEERSARLTQAPRRRWYKTRLAALWLLYFVAEGAIIATELAELVGSAIALNLLFPALPLWAGVLLTSVDCLLILLVYSEGRSMRVFEAIIALLVFVVMACFGVLLARVDADWGDVFHGYLPSSTVVQSEALYIGVGILGATVMPHALFNASSWATVNRLEYDAEPPRQNEASAAPSPASHWWLVRRFGSLRRSMHRRFESLPSMRLGGPRIPSPDAKAAAPAPSVASIKIHLAHATADIVLSLLCFALVVNSAILIVAAASFYFAPQRQQVGDLFDAFELIKRTVGHSSAILFAVALLAAGQSASLTVTLAGQLVSEGFIHWTTNPFWRRVLTRAIALLPSFTIAAAVGRGGLDRMLVASQVALSMALPFVLVPLLVITSSKTWMTVREARNVGEAEAAAEQAGIKADEPATPAAVKPETPGTPGAVLLPYVSSPPPLPPADAEAQERVGRFASPWPVVLLCWLIYALIVLCDGFVVVTSAMGKS